MPVRMAASALMIWVSPQAISVHGTTLLTRARKTKGPHAAGLRGSVSPRQRITAQSTSAPRTIRAAAMLTGGTVGSASLISM